MTCSPLKGLVGAACVLLFVPALVACQGSVSDAGQRAGDPPPVQLPEIDHSAPPECDAAGIQALTTSVRVRTREELRSSIETSFGSQVLEAVAGQLASFPDDGPSLEPGAEYFERDVSQEEMERLFRLADAVGRAAFSSGRLDTMHSCPGSELSRECAAELLTSVAQLLFHRALELAETDELIDAVGENRNDAAALLSSLLLSPEFVFRTFETEPGTDLVLSLTQTELARRLSHAVIAAPPDAALLALASNGELRGEVIESEVRRLVTSPAGRANVVRFFEEWMEVKSVPPVPAIDGVTDGFDVETLPQDAQSEFHAYVEHMVFEREANFEQLFLGQEFFPLTENLANYVGTVPSTEPVIDPELTRGLLYRPAKMIAGQLGTRPIIRGVFVLREFLCSPVPFPGDELIDAREDQDAMPIDRTTRELTAALTAAPICAECHAVINPLGFAMEDVDALGRLRSEEFAFEDAELVTYPVNATATIEVEGERRALTGAQDLLSALEEDPRTRVCFARKVFRYSQLRAETADNADRCHVERIHQTVLRDGASILDAFVTAHSEAVLANHRLETP